MATTELTWTWRDTSLIVIDAHSTCGPKGRRTWDGIALVREPMSPNPCVELPKALGVNLIRQIIDYVEERPWNERPERS